MKTILSLMIFALFCAGDCFAQEPWTLEQCIAHAKENSIEIARQQQQNLKTEEDITIAKGNYFPTASMNLSQGYRLGNSFDVSTGVGALNSRFNGVSFGSNIDLFNGFKNKYLSEQAEINRLKGHTEIERIGLDLSLTISSKYLEVSMNKEIAILAEEQVSISDLEVIRLKKLFDVALSTKSEYLEMKATNELDKKEWIAAQNRVTTGLLELQDLLDVKRLVDFDIAAIEISTADDMILMTSVDSIQAKALLVNPLLKSTSFDAENAAKAIKVAKANFFPSISLGYNVGSNYYHVQGSVDERFNPALNEYVPNGFFTQLENNLTHGISISASIPIFNRFNTKSSVDKAKIDFSLAELELENQKKELKNKIEIAYNDVFTKKTAIGAAKAAAIAQEEAFTINQRKYKNGMISNFEFLESKKKYIQTQSELIRAKFEYLFQLKVLEYYQN